MFQVTPDFWGSILQGRNSSVLIGMAAGNIGKRWRGASAYFQQLLAHLKAIRALVDVEALVMVAQLHRLRPAMAKHTAACTRNPAMRNICTLCNSERRQLIFREMIRNAAACSNTSLFDTFAMTDTFFARSASKDPVHYNDSVDLMKALQVANYVCTRPDGTRLRSGDPGHCQANPNYDALMRPSNSDCRCCAQPRS